MQHMEHALVLGASMGGLLAARVLSERFERVTLLERDPLDGGVAPRRGVPQGRHAHGLLASGLRTLEALYPGLTRDLTSRGALSGDVCGDCLWFQHGGAKLRVPGQLPGLLLSRPLLEDGVRRHTLTRPNVTLRQGRAEGLMLSGARVTGVQVADEDLEADLVVDATGRGSRLPAWLGTLGYDAPQQSTVEIGLTYTTRTFTRRPGDMGGLTAAIIAETPPEGKHFGVMLAQENGWTVTLGGVLGCRAPEDLAGFRAFAARLPTPEIAEVLAVAGPLGEATTFGYPASVRRHYERLNRFPAGLLAFGDALCSFDPVYGQGMSVAALEALALRDCLAKPGAGPLWRRFFRAAARVADIPWTLAVGGDLQFPEVPGRRTALTGFVNRYVSRVHVAAQHDPVVSLAFLRVANLLAPPRSLFAPGLVRRVLRASGTGRRARTDAMREAYPGGQMS